jgi:hypothetical protein
VSALKLIRRIRIEGKMVARASATRDIFKDLRQTLFFGEPGLSSNIEALRGDLVGASDQEKFTLWRRLRGLGVVPEPSMAHTVLGVIVELALDDGGTALVFGFDDGSASVYYSSGGGSIGGQARPHINRAARDLTRLAAGFVATFPLTEHHPLPGPGAARFSILTPAGVHVAEEQQGELASSGHPVSALLAAAKAIMSGFLDVEEPQANDEASYVRCLLTTLARGRAPAATLTKGLPLPNPATLTSDPKELEWIERLAFPLDRLSTRKVIGIILRSAGFRRFRPESGKRTLYVKLATSAGISQDVGFLVSCRKDQGRTQLELRCPTLGD